jgi:prophage antirepressor-like protein
MAFSLNAEAAAFIAPSGNISPASFQSVPTAAIPFLPSKIKVAHLLPERKPIMDNKIEVFKNEQFGEVRTILDGETLLFCGSDVARALGYARPNEAVARHAKGTLKQRILTNGGEQEMLFITEGDVYRLIVRSKLPAAEKFERWLFDEVVPMIRKTGGYMTDSLLERIQKEPAVIMEFAQALILEKNRVKALECELNTAKPKADYYDAFINPDDCTNIRTTAKELKIPERKFVQFLLREKYLFRSPSGQLLPYNKDSNAGLFIVRDFVTYCYTGSQTYFTPKGKDVIRMKFQKKCAEELLPEMAR